MLKVQEGSVESVYAMGYDSTLIVAVLFGASASVLIIGMSFMIEDLKANRAQEAIRYRSSGKQVQLRKLSPGRNHLFLSHARDYGADSCAAIKYLLEQNVIGIKCFLDVESLWDTQTTTSLQDLPKLVRQSENVALFVTTGIFSRQVLNL